MKFWIFETCWNFQVSFEFSTCSKQKGGSSIQDGESLLVLLQGEICIITVFNSINKIWTPAKNFSYCCWACLDMKDWKQYICLHSFLYYWTIFLTSHICIHIRRQYLLTELTDVTHVMWHSRYSSLMSLDIPVTSLDIPDIPVTS